MPTPTKGPRLGGSPAHQRLMLANLSVQLFEHGRITTTVTKAKRLRPFAERLITIAKRGDLASRRRVQSVLAPRSRTNKAVVYELMENIAPAMAGRDGGYTRITKIGNRAGDNAPMAVIELVLEPVTPKASAVKTATAAAPAEPEVDEVAADEVDAAAGDTEASEPTVDGGTQPSEAADAAEAAESDADEKADDAK